MQVPAIGTGLAKVHKVLADKSSTEMEQAL
jgi:hypothetical protein